MSTLAEYLNLDYFDPKKLEEDFELSVEEYSETGMHTRETIALFEDVVDNVTEMAKLANDLDYYTVGYLGGIGTPGIDVNIKLHNISLGEDAPNYNPDHDDEFAAYLMEIYFRSALESLQEELKSEFGVNSAISGKSGGHLVLIPDLYPFKDWEVNDFETMAEVSAEYLREIENLTKATEYAEAAVKGYTKDPTLLAEERDVWEQETFMSYDDDEHSPDWEIDDHPDEDDFYIVKDDPFDD